MPDILLDVIAQAAIALLYMSILPLSASMSVGLLLGVLQAVTQVQEQSLTFVAKILAAACTLYLSRNIWLAELAACFQSAFDSVGQL